MAISDFLLKNFDLVIYLVSLGAANTRNSCKWFVASYQAIQNFIGFGTSCSLDFRCTNYQDVHSYQSLMRLTPFWKTCNFYRHVCNEIAGALLSPSLVLTLYNSVHTGKKNSYLQFYKPGTLCKPHSILVSLRTHLEIYLII